MKSLINHFLLLFALVSLAACSRSASDPSVPMLPQTLTQGEWRVSYYWDEDHEETQDFAGYTFSFNANQELSIQAPDGSTLKGNWIETQDDNLPRLVITVNSPKPLDRLNEDWVIKLSSEDKIELEDDNPAKREILHFSRK